MSDKALAGRDSPIEQADATSTSDGTADVRTAVAMVAEAGQMLDTLTQLAARQREKLSAAERLLAELDAARSE